MEDWLGFAGVHAAAGKLVVGASLASLIVGAVAASPGEDRGTSAEGDGEFAVVGWLGSL